MHKKSSVTLYRSSGPDLWGGLEMLELRNVLNIKEYSEKLTSKKVLKMIILNPRI
jgi:hypothetical protein